MKQIPGTYIFREISDEAELLQAFRLRYRVYQQAPHLLRLLSQDNPANIDLDGYDSYSRHFGIFKRVSQGDAMVGCLRVVEHQQKEWVAAVVERLERAHGFRAKTRTHTFFHLHIFPGLETLLGEPLLEDGRFSEPGRFVLLPEHRSVGLAQFAIASVMAWGFSNPVLQTGLIDCQKAHCRIYECNGFRWVTAQSDAPDAWHLMVINRATVEQRMPDLQQRMQQYHEQGGFVLELGRVDWSAWQYLPVALRRRVRRLRRSILGWAARSINPTRLL